MKLKTKFQDEDFDLGEVVEANVYHGGSGRIKVITEPTKGGMITFYFESLKGLNEMFEDYEEPKCSALDLMILTLTNFIENEPDEDKVDLEDCKQMLEKLKAWKRLEGHNLRVERGQRIFVNADNKLTSQKPLFVVDTYEEVENDLDLLFGEEEK